MGFFACSLGVRPDARPEIEWEEPRCLLCKSNQGSILIEAPDSLPGSGGLWFAITQCQDCGLCFTNPRPSVEAIAQFYPDRCPSQDEIPKRRQRQWWPWRLSHRGLHSNLKRLPIQGQGRLLDFGCGDGTFLMHMHQRGWKVTGIDASQQAIERIRTHLGLTAVVGSLPHEELGEGCFDVVTMRHTLEHVHQPLEVLRAAQQVLVPGGQIIVCAPNIDSLPFKWFGRHWRGLDLPRHLTHFTPDTLQLMLARAGFDVGTVRMVRHSEWIRRSAVLAGHRPETPRWQRWLSSRVAASLTAWYANYARRSDAMIVSAVKVSSLPHMGMLEFSPHARRSGRFPADRWRNT